MPRMRINCTPARDTLADEAALHAAARAAGLHVFYRGAARREGRPHVEITDRFNSVLRAFRNAAQALEWLQGGQQEVRE